MKTMKTRASSHLERRQAVLRIFEQEGWGSLELVDDWDGEELEELRTILNEEEFQTLLDQLRDQEDTRR